MLQGKILTGICKWTQLDVYRNQKWTQSVGREIIWFNLILLRSINAPFSCRRLVATITWEENEPTTTDHRPARREVYQHAKTFYTC